MIDFLLNYLYACELSYLVTVPVAWYKQRKDPDCLWDARPLMLANIIGWMVLLSWLR